MTSVIIVGSGPSAAGAALAAVEHQDVQVTVVDVGGRLELDRADAKRRLALTPRSEWRPRDVAAITQQPVKSPVRGVPEKRTYGSDYPFRDFGQRRGVIATAGMNDAVVSGGYGGFSDAWGAQFMPFTAAAFERWPVSSEEMREHYRAVLRRVPFAAEEDDLADLFPLLVEGVALPPVSPRTETVLARYARHRDTLRGHGVVVGRARLAMDAENCKRCGLCMTGCPYSLVYSASQTLETLRRDSRIMYEPGLLAVRIDEGPTGVTVIAKELLTGSEKRFESDIVMLACGALGTARLVMGSLGLFDRSATMSESQQFVLPFLSRAPVADPLGRPDFTLNQFNMAVALDRSGRDVSLLHFYAYNPSFARALPPLLRRSRATWVRGQVLRRLTVALGYLPSWASPKIVIRAEAPENPGALPTLRLAPSGDRTGVRTNEMLRATLSGVVASARLLDLWPILPALTLAAEGKSYHWGGIFPHAERPAGPFSSDTLGRVHPWRRVHLVDSSVFPTIPATTFALTSMANAHRIAEGAIRECAAHGPFVHDPRTSSVLAETSG